MARPWRIQYKAAYYHVLSRGNEGRAIFYDDQDRRIFLDTLGEASDRFGAEILAFVLMTNTTTSCCKPLAPICQG